ncbi:hypothetical protein ACRBEV_25335 [Methylobacterium phyllosphaerae]
MASGYVVAAFLELVGLAGLVIAVLRMRTERQARSAELRSFLRSGHMPAAGVVGSQTDVASRVVAILFNPARDSAEPVRPSAARTALGRAIPTLRNGLSAAISAG